MTAKQLTRIGGVHIKEAILETLFESDDEYVRAAEITRKCGISQSWNDSGWVIACILYKLEEDQRVEARRGRSGQRSGWKLTTREKNRRADVSN